MRKAGPRPRSAAGPVRDSRAPLLRQIAHRAITAMVIPVAVAVDDVTDLRGFDAHTREIGLHMGRDSGAYGGVEQQRRAGAHEQVDTVDPAAQRRLDPVNTVSDFHATPACFHYRTSASEP